LVAVRLNAVEDVFHLFSGAFPEHQGLSNTIVTPLNYFAGGPSRIKVHNMEELVGACGSWESPLRVKVLPYLNRAKDVISLDAFVNVTNEIFDITNPPSCFIHSIIIAKQAANPNYNHLVSHHRAEMRDMGYETDEYDRVVDYLNKQ
jgi:hypothetical protein